MNEVPFYTPCSLQIKLLYNPATTKYTSNNYYNNYYNTTMTTATTTTITTK